MLLISFIPFCVIIFNCIKSYFWGFKIVMMSGIDCPLYFGFEAVYEYLWIMFSFRYFGIITIPVIILCVLYQIWYFRKNSNLF